MEFRISELHLFKRLGKDILFNVETMLFYEVTPVVYALVAHLLEDPSADPVKALKGKYPRAAIRNAISYLQKEGFLKNGASNAAREEPGLIKRRGIRHLELMVTHGCNMACRYCYGSRGPREWEGSPYLYGAGAGRMPFEVARKGIDFLFEASGNRKDLSVIFFGGEPLLETGLLEEIVSHIRGKEKESGKKAELSTSTNGLLLNEKTVGFLTRNRIGCQVSIDGPRELQDKNRCLPDGSGSYESILPGIKRLMAGRKNSVPARATVTRGQVRIVEIVEHLLSLGFGSVHVEPALGKDGDTVLTGEDVEEIKRQHEALALYLVKSVRSDRYFNYTNLVRFIRQTRVIRERLAHYCGAGRTYFALSQDGFFYPCHRFVGLEEYRMGHIDRGMEPALARKILDLTVDRRPGCRECWARYLCGGGCWKHAVDMNGSLEAPDLEFSCKILRHEVECAMAINSELKVNDKDILDRLYEEATEPYLVTEREGSGGGGNRGGGYNGEKGLSEVVR